MRLLKLIQTTAILLTVCSCALYANWKFVVLSDVHYDPNYQNVEFKRIVDQIRNTDYGDHSTTCPVKYVAVAGDVTFNPTQSNFDVRARWAFDTLLYYLNPIGTKLLACRGNHEGNSFYTGPWREVLRRYISNGFLATRTSFAPDTLNYRHTTSSEDGSFSFIMLDQTVDWTWLSGQTGDSSKIIMISHNPLFVIDQTDVVDLRGLILTKNFRFYFTGHEHFPNHGRFSKSKGYRRKVDQFINSNAGRVTTLAQGGSREQQNNGYYPPVMYWTTTQQWRMPLGDISKAQTGYNVSEVSPTGMVATYTVVKKTYVCHCVNPYYHTLYYYSYPTTLARNGTEKVNNAEKTKAITNGSIITYEDDNIVSIQKIPEWEPKKEAKTLAVDDIRAYKGRIWKCHDPELAQDKAPGSAEGSQAWTQILCGGPVSEKEICDWDAHHDWGAYTKGDLRRHNGKLWSCLDPRKAQDYEPGSESGHIAWVAQEEFPSTQE